MGAKGRREEIRAYYDGYRFSPNATRTVYNSDMILYYGIRCETERGRPENVIDVNVVSDYRKIRAVLSIGEKDLEEEILARIVRDDKIAVNKISELFVLTQETEFLFDARAIASLLFYMGYLTIGEKYVKVVLMSLLSDVNVYIPRSEFETDSDGYVDLYLQAAYRPEESPSYFIELKYVSADAPESALDEKEREGRKAMEKYARSRKAKSVRNLRCYVLVFRKDRCVRKVRCHIGS